MDLQTSPLRVFRIFSSLEAWQESLCYTVGFPSLMFGPANVYQWRCDFMTQCLQGNHFTSILQLCASVQVPKALGGLQAEALFIDTNTKFTVLRLIDILKASMSKCQRLLDQSGDVDIEKYLDKFHYVDAFGLEKFRAVLQELPKLLLRNPNIRLIVIDSICFLFKDGISERKRTGMLFTELAALQRTAFEKRIAVVLTNEMSTRIGLSDGDVVGAMGDAWAHRCNTRILLSRPHASRTERIALILKSHSTPQTVACFQVTAEGIRDIEEN